jgi:hypothetical protein
MLGLRMDNSLFYMKPFRTIDFSLKDVELGGTRFTIQVQSGWTKAFLNGKPEAIPVQVPRIQKSCRLDFVR